MNKVRIDHLVKLSVTHAQGEANIEYLHAGDTSPVHVSLPMELSSINAMSTMQQGQITCAGQDFKQASHQQCHLYPRRAVESSGKPSYEQQTTSTGTNELVGDENNDFFFGMCEIEEFYVDERSKRHD